MQLIILSDNAIRLHAAGESLTITSRAPRASLTPFHMMGAALGHCSLSVLLGWARQVDLTAADLIIEVAWVFADAPRRVGRYDLRFFWPSLPAPRLEAAKRVIEACAVHQTLLNPPTISVIGTSSAPADDQAARPPATR